MTNGSTRTTDELDEGPFNQTGGLGRAYEIFGDKLPALLAELNGGWRHEARGDARIEFKA